MVGIEQRFVSRRVFGTHTRRHRRDNRVETRPIEKRDGMPKRIIVVDHPMRGRGEPVVGIPPQHLARIDDEGARDASRADPLALRGADLQPRQSGLRQQRQKIGVDMRCEPELVVLGAIVPRVTDQPQRAGGFVGESGGKVIRRQVQTGGNGGHHHICQRSHRGDISQRGGLEARHSRRPPIEPIQRIAGNNPGIVRR